MIIAAKADRILAFDARDNPTDGFIDRIRQLYRIEPEMDRVLSAKMRSRAGPSYSEVPLAHLAECTANLIRQRTGASVVLENPRWLGGGASKIQMAFGLKWRGHEHREMRRDAMVLRMQPQASIVETSRLREYQMMKFMRGIVPVPECYWVDSEATHLPLPGLIYSFMDGVTTPTQLAGDQPTGVGTKFGLGLRQRLAQQFVEQLAAIHNASDRDTAALDAFEPAHVDSVDSIIRQVNWWRRVWEEDKWEASPLVEVAAQWLIANAQPLDHVSVVHGDFRTGNFLFNEDSQQITAWLDWELSVFGDRHQDLVWATGPHLGTVAEDGKTFLACGLLPIDELLARYEASSGLRVDPKRLKYFRVFNDFVSTVHMLATACRVSRHSKTHQDVVVAWLAMIGNVIAGALRETLEDII